MHFQRILIIWIANIIMLFLYSFFILMARLKGNPLIWDNPKSLKNIIPALKAVEKVDSPWILLLGEYELQDEQKQLSLRWRRFQHGMKFWKNIFHGPNIFLAPEELIFKPVNNKSISTTFYGVFEKKFCFKFCNWTLDLSNSLIKTRLET